MDLKNLKSGQTVLDDYTMMHKQGVIFPAYTKTVPVGLNTRCFQILNRLLGFFQQSKETTAGRYDWKSILRLIEHFTTYGIRKASGKMTM